MAIIAAQIGWPEIITGNEMQASSIHAVRAHKDSMVYGHAVNKQVPLKAGKPEHKDVISLSERAQHYLEGEQERSISQVTSQLNMAAKIISNSMTSDSQRLAIISSAYHLFFMGSTLGAITGNFASAWGQFKAATSDNDFEKYFAVEKQFVPSLSSIAGENSEKNKPDLWAQFFTSHDVSDKIDRKNQSAERQEGILERKASGPDTLDIEAARVKRDLVSYESVRKNLISLVNTEKALTPHDKRGLGKNS